MAQVKDLFVSGNARIVGNLYANNLNSIYYVAGNTSGTNGIWTGTNDFINHYYDGLTIAYRVGILPGASATTLNINGLGAKNIRRNTTNVIQTFYQVGTVLILTYSNGEWVTGDSMTVYQKNNVNDANFPILTKASSGTSADEINTVNYCATILANPSSGRITATTFKGKLIGDVTGNVDGEVIGNASTATKLRNSRTIDGVIFDGSKNIVHYGVCSTAGSTAIKEVIISGFNLTAGARVLVKFDNNNSVANPQLKISANTEKPIFFRGSALSSDYYWSAGAVLEFIYDGTNFELINTPNDTYVYQSALNSTDTNEYALLTRASSITGTSNNNSNTVKYKEALKFQPSTNRLTTGGLTLTGGHLFLTGAVSNSSSSNTTQIIFGPQTDDKTKDHLALSSNNDLLVINSNRADTSPQITLGINGLSKFPKGIEITGTGANDCFIGRLKGYADKAKTIDQNAVAESDYTNYRSLVWGPCNSASEGFSPVTSTGNLFASQSLYCRPSTGMLHAKIFKATGKITLDDGTTTDATSTFSAASLNMSGNNNSLNLDLKNGYFGAENTTDGTASLLNSTALMFSKNNSGTITSMTLAYDSANNTLETDAYFSAARVYGAVFNDYAEYRKSKEHQPGLCLIEKGDGELIPSTQRLQPGANIVSDTFGFAIGETDECKTPLAVSGRVLAYPYENIEEYNPGDAVCSGPDGTISKMSREEIREYPERIVGTVSEIPKYETWGENNVKINGRIWIKVR